MLHCVIASSSELSWWVSWKIQQTRVTVAVEGWKRSGELFFFFQGSVVPEIKMWFSVVGRTKSVVSLFRFLLGLFFSEVLNTIPCTFFCSPACLNLPVVICSCSNNVIEHAVKHSQMLVANFLKSRKKKTNFLACSS